MYQVDTFNQKMRNNYNEEFVEPRYAEGGRTYVVPTSISRRWSEVATWSEM